MKTCITLPDLAFPVTVAQTTRGRFTVTYGKQIQANLEYTDAAHAFGEAVFHALACDGKFDNRKG